MLRSPEQPANPKTAAEDKSNLIVRSATPESELSVERSLRERAQRTAGLLWRLQSLTAAFAGAQTTDEIAESVVTTGLAAMDAASGALALLNDEGTTLTIIRAAGYKSDVATTWKTFDVLDNLPLSEAVRTRELVLLESQEEPDARYPKLAGETTANNSFACVPLIVEQRVVGGLTYSFGDPRAFTDDERSFLLALGQLTAQALERARLYEAEHRAREHAEAGAARLRFLAQTSDLLASSLEYEQTLMSVARSCVPKLADWCVVDLLEDNGSVKTLAVEHADAEKVDWALRLRERFPEPVYADSGVRRVIRSGQPSLFEEVTDEGLVQSAHDEEHLAILRELGMTSVMIVPMRARDRVIGAITFVSTRESGRHYGPDDLNLAHEVAHRAAVAVENARLFEEHRHISITLQRSLLPPHLPEIPGVDVAARYHAAGEGYEVGGDFYDLFKTTRGEWAVVLGDVCGKGADAAATTALARHTLRAAAMQTRKPPRVLSLLNEALLNAEQPFCTVVYARVQSVGTGVRVTVACGGHPLPFVLRTYGTIETLGRPGTLLGCFPKPALYEESLELHPGDAVVLFTDGVTEARKGSNVMGEAGLRAALVRSADGSAGDIADAIEGAALDFQDGNARDDIAIVVLKVRSPRPES